MSNPYDVVKQFESALCEYTGAKYAVTVTSCTMALLLAVRWHIKDYTQCYRPPIQIPKYTYCSVPMAIHNAGGWPVFRDHDWQGYYQLLPFEIYDSARWFYSGMYQSGRFQCVSFHASKTLGDTQGGAILHDNQEADAWFRRMRFDGRTEGVAPKDDNFREIGQHCYLSPDVAARLLIKLSALPKHNDPLPWGPGTSSDYTDLSTLEIFK